MKLSCHSPISRLSPSQQLALKVPFGILAVASTLLNAFAVGLFFKEKSLRTFSNAFYMSLVVSDFLVGSVLSPLTVVQLSTPGETQRCIISNIEAPFFSLLSVPAFIISVIAYERVQLFLRAETYQQFMTTWKKICLLAAPWITPLVLVAARLLVEDAISWIILVIYISSYSVLVCCYVRLYNCLGKRQVDLNQFDDSGAQKYLRHAIHRQNQKVARLILFISIAYIGCTIWIFIHRVIMTVHRYQPEGLLFFKAHGPLMFAIGMFMYQLNSALNPILYFVKHQEFKRALLRLFRKRRGKIGIHPATLTPKVITSQPSSLS